MFRKMDSNPMIDLTKSIKYVFCTYFHNNEKIMKKLQIFFYIAFKYKKFNDGLESESKIISIKSKSALRYRNVIKK